MRSGGKGELDGRYHVLGIQEAVERTVSSYKQTICSSAQQSISGDGRFRGPWFCDDARGEFRGNPADSHVIQDLMKSIKNMNAKEGKGRQHALAMKYEYLEKIMNWSEAQCPSSSVDAHLQDRSEEERFLRINHLRRRAHHATAFTLWTR